MVPPVVIVAVQRAAPTVARAAAGAAARRGLEQATDRDLQLIAEDLLADTPVDTSGPVESRLLGLL